MLTEYDLKQQARERQQHAERQITQGYAFSNATRDRVRLSAERSRREASKLDAYLAERQRQIAAAQLADSPFDWEREGVLA